MTVVNGIFLKDCTNLNHNIEQFWYIAHDALHSFPFHIKKKRRLVHFVELRYILNKDRPHHQHGNQI